MVCFETIWNRNGRLRAALLTLLFLAYAVAMPALGGPLTYYVLAPEHSTGSLSVMSLEPNNTISTGFSQRQLQTFQTTTIPATELTPGTIISGSGHFSVASNQNAADMLAPSTFAGTSFIIPHIAGSHTYYVLATTNTASVTVTIGASVSTVAVPRNQVVEIVAGSDNSVVGAITSDQPIVVVHVAQLSASSRDAYPVPPAASSLLGIRSQNIVLATGATATVATVYASNGTSTSYNLGAYQKAVVTVGASGAQGAGDAVQIVAAAPIAAVQYDDGDGADATALWSSAHFGRRFAVAANAQYLAFACNQAGVSLTLYKGTLAPETQSCSGSSTTPGKAYFGLVTNGTNLPAGWYVLSSAPAYMMAEVSASDDEHNSLPWNNPAGPAAPTLNAVTSPTSNNPQTISGTAVANATVRLYINGRLRQSATANGTGAFTIAAELFDGINQLYVTAVSSGNESMPSNVVAVTYNNSIPRTQSGTISANAVWTPGNPATPYVISANLTVAAGVQLTLQPGTTLRMANGAIIAATGTLKIAGEPGNPVVLTCNAATCTRGIWNGIDALTATSNVSIDYATIDWAATGVEVNNGTGSVRNSTITNFSANGIWVQNVTNAFVIANNLIDNGNDTVDCIETSSGSPTISGNTIRNCSKGINVYLNSSPVVNGNNIVTSNTTGVWVEGNLTQNPLPVVTGNQIFSNSSNNYRAYRYQNAVGVILNATGNWWGSSDLTSISGGIDDLTDNYTNQTQYPSVNFASPLDSATGSQIAGNYLIGPFSATATTLTANTTYQVIGVIFVAAGRSLTVPAGTTLRFHGAGTHLVVDGTLSVQGAAGNLATLTSGRSVPARNDWPGIRLRANGAVINYARIEYAGSGVNATGFSATISNSTIRYFQNDGILLNGAASSTSVIQNNLIDNINDSGDCIELYSSSPAISGNTLQNCSRGIYVLRNSSPTVNGNNIITSNVTGVFVEGDMVNNPLPVVTGNQIFSNSGNNYRAYRYQNAVGVILNATGNWWGSTNLTTISDGIDDLTDNYTNPTNYPTVNFASPLDGPNGAPVAGNYLTGPFSATATTLTSGATYQVIGTIFVAAGRSLTVPAGATLRFHGAGTHLVVDGTLSVQGAAGNLATLTSGRSVPARNDWPGIRLRANGAVINYARIEYAGSGVNATGFSATISNSTIRLFQNDGIYLEGAASSASVIQNNLIDNINDSGDCIDLYSSSPAITGNTLQNCSRGINVLRNSSPTINGNNIITSNGTGLFVEGDLVNNPLPVVNGNQIFGNTTNVRAYRYLNATGLLLNATGNWWGSIDLTAISDSIDDLTDNYTNPTNYPTVNFASPLDGPNGAPVAGNYLTGPFSATATTLTSGATYQVIGTIFVAAGRSLTVPAGVTLRFHGPGTHLVVDGTLSVQGAAGNLATLTSGRSVPARNDWPGIRLRANGAVINYARIEYAGFGVSATGFSATISNSTIRLFQNDGIYLEGTASSASVIQNNLIDNINDSGNCIELYSSSPAITGNTLQNCSYGINVFRNSSPTVNGNNIITSNGVGLFVEGDLVNNPLPVVTGNQIFGNNTNVRAYRYLNATGTPLNATGNWWGTTNPWLIASEISDYTDQYDDPIRYPIVDFRGFLNGPNGTAVAGNQLIGSLVPASTTLTAGATYDVLGALTVPAGKTLTVPGGVVLRISAKDATIIVKGAMQFQGTAASRVALLSGSPLPQRGDWRGVVVHTGASGVDLNYFTSDHSSRGVDVAGSTAVIRNAVIRRFSQAGVYVTSTTAGTEIRSSLIDDLGENRGNVAYGVYAAGTSPLITGNRIQGIRYGVYLTGGANPTITSNIIRDNLWGIYVEGNGSNLPAGNPNPLINGNDLISNSSASLQFHNYGSSNPIVVNATGNYWGVATPLLGTHVKVSGTTPTSIVNFSGHLSSPINGASASALTVSDSLFSPNSDGVQDSIALAATLSQSSAWTLNVLSPSGTIVRTFTGSGTAVSANWDGRNSSAQVVPDGFYQLTLSVPGSPDPLTVAGNSTGVDNTVPVASIASPVAGVVLQNAQSIGVTGTASDTYFVNRVLDYGSGTNPTTWTEIATGTTPRVGGDLGTWLVNAANGSIALTGPQVLRLRVTDDAGNVGTALAPVTLDNITAGAISANLAQIRPLLGEQLTVNFTLSAPATAYLRIYPDLGGAMLREISQTFATAGPKSLSWDGRNASNAYVDDEAYRYVLVIVDGVRTSTYDPPDADSVGFGSGTVDASFNAHTNDFWKMTYTLSDAKARVRMEVSGCVTPTHYPYNWVPFVQGTHPVIWDGRDAAGNLASGNCAIWFEAPDPLRPFSVIVKGVSPGITGRRPAPNVEVDGEPFLAVHSFDQVGRFTYRLTQDSVVTVKVLPPGVTNFSDPAAIVLVNGVTQTALSAGQPADYTFEWRGYDSIDTNNIQVATEGTYMVAIQAVSVSTGRTVMYRGSLQLYQ